MSAYEELRNRIADSIALNTGPLESRAWLGLAEDILAEVLRTLETVTQEMDTARRGVLPTDGLDIHKIQWLAMLHASPLDSPKDGGP